MLPYGGYGGRVIEWVCLSGGSGEEESMYIVIWEIVSCFVSVKITSNYNANTGNLCHPNRL